MRQEHVLIKIFIASVFLPCAAIAQVSVSVSSGYGSWAMKEMQNWQEEYSDSFPVEAKTFASFPSYLFFEALVIQQRDQWIRGLAVSTGSTGGRVYYSDYSGRTSLDQRLSYYAFSGVVGRTINQNTEKWLMIISMRPGVMISKMSYDYEQVIDGSVSEEVFNKFSSYNFTIQPGFSVMRKIATDWH